VDKKPRILIVGGSGLLGVNWAFFARNEYQVVLAQHHRIVNIKNVQTCHIALDSMDDIVHQIQAIKPNVIINAAGMTNVEKCESDPNLAKVLNVDFAGNLALACYRFTVPMVHISTDHLFSGEFSFIDEMATCCPVNVYGQTKALGESQVLSVNPNVLVIRTNFFGWGPTYRQSFSDLVIDGLRAGNALTLFEDVYFSPIHISMLAKSIHDLINVQARGIFNVVGDERISKKDFGLRLAQKFNLNSALIKAGSIENAKFLTRRPKDMSLSNIKICTLLQRKMGNIDEQIQALYEQEKDGLIEEVRSL
jgi:dTDP-4-dehydrorhamnose reductase